MAARDCQWEQARRQDGSGKEAHLLKQGLQNSKDPEEQNLPDRRRNRLVQTCAQRFDGLEMLVVR